MALYDLVAGIFRRISGGKDRPTPEFLNSWHEVRPLIQKCRCEAHQIAVREPNLRSAKGKKRCLPGDDDRSAEISGAQPVGGGSIITNFSDFAGEGPSVSMDQTGTGRENKKRFKNSRMSEKTKKTEARIEAIYELGTLAGQNAEPLARSGHRIWANEEFLYSIGGYNPENDRLPDDSDDPMDQDEPAHTDRPLLKEVWRLNLLTDCWHEIETTGNFPKQVASFAMMPDMDYGRLVLFGGTAIPFGNTATNAVHSLDIFGLNRGQWKRLKPEDPNSTPIRGYGQAVTPVENDEAYVIGGTTGFEYNMRVHKLQFLRPPPPPRTQCDSLDKISEPKNFFEKQQDTTAYGSADSEDLEQYLEPGDYDSDSESSRSDESYDTIQSGEDKDNETAEIRWESLLEGPECPARYRHETIRHGNKLLVFGGGTRDATYGFEILDAFCLREKKWRSVGTVPDGISGVPGPRRCHGFAHFENQVYIIGGLDATTVLRDTWSLNLDTMQWSRLADLPEAIYFHGSTVSPDGCLYCFGGVLDMQGTKRTNKTYRMWIRPPPLQWLAARSLLKNFPEISGLTRDSMKNAGIPQALVDYMRNADLAA